MSNDTQGGDRNSENSTPSEGTYRLSVFYDQLTYIEESNRDYELKAKEFGQVLTAPMFEINMFGDLTTEEFQARYTGASSMPDEVLVSEESTPVEVPDSPQLSSTAPHKMLAGYNIEIRQQGSCGSCWAFSAVAGLEKFHFDKTGQRLSFSQQELVDCGGGGTCQGGLSERAFTYVATKGLMQASNYPYRGSDGRCQKDIAKSVKINNQGSGSYQYSHTKAKYLASKQVHASLYMYSSGKFRYASSSSDTLDARATGECQNGIDHTINMSTASGDTITVFNSWGTRWGNNGFKNIRVCGENNLWASNSKISHCYGNNV